jgi:hypothetical protein
MLKVRVKIITKKLLQKCLNLITLKFLKIKKTFIVI